MVSAVDRNNFYSTRKCSKEILAIVQDFIVNSAKFYLGENQWSLNNQRLEYIAHDVKVFIDLIMLSIPN